jgi:hypothetical protein
MGVHDLVWPAAVLLALTAGLGGALWSATRPVAARGRRAG